MSDVVIKVENLSKHYRLGEIGGTTLREDLERWWQRRKGGDVASEAQDAKDHWALRDVSFEVRQGEVLGVIGRNGAGKSTLLKVLSRTTSPTKGRALVKGRIGSLLEVGTGFHPELSGRENIYLNGAILGMKSAEIGRKIDEIVDFSGVEKFIDTPVKRYSSGMYVRLAFAVAAHLEPEILIVDEVLAVGDAEFQRKCMNKMGSISAGQGRTVIFVSHNMAAIEKICPRSVLLAGGELAVTGDTRSVIQRHLSSVELDAITPIPERTDRSGLGEIRFTKIEFLDKQGKEVLSARSGECLRIRLHYRASSKKKLPFCRASVSVHRAGKTYFLASTELVRDDELVIAGDGYVECEFPELPLSQGVYYVNPFVESRGVIQDFLEGAAVFNVEDGDFYGTGKTYPPGWAGQCVLVPHQWSWR